MKTSPATPTLEFDAARVHPHDPFAGIVEISFRQTGSQLSSYDLDMFLLEVDENGDLLYPMGVEFTLDHLVLRYYSEYLRELGRAPRSLRLHWGEPMKEMQCGMALTFQEVS